MNKTDCDEQALTIVNDTDTYKPLDKKLTKKIENIVNKNRDKLEKDLEI